MCTGGGGSSRHPRSGRLPPAGSVPSPSSWRRSYRHPARISHHTATDPAQPLSGERPDITQSSSVVTTDLGDHTDRSFAQLRGIGGRACHESTLSRNRVSTEPGAVHLETTMIKKPMPALLLLRIPTTGHAPTNRMAPELATALRGGRTSPVIYLTMRSIVSHSRPA